MQDCRTSFRRQEDEIFAVAVHTTMAVLPVAVGFDITVGFFVAVGFDITVGFFVAVGFDITVGFFVAVGFDITVGFFVAVGFSRRLRHPPGRGALAPSPLEWD